MMTETTAAIRSEHGKQIAFRVNNLDATRQFYEHVIGLPLMTPFANSTFFKIADGYGGHTQVPALFDRSQSPATARRTPPHSLLRRQVCKQQNALISANI